MLIGSASHLRKPKPPPPLPTVKEAGGYTSGVSYQATAPGPFGSRRLGCGWSGCRFYVFGHRQGSTKDEELIVGGGEEFQREREREGRPQVD